MDEVLPILHHSIYNIYIYIYSIGIINIIRIDSGISMVDMIPCLCDSHGLVHVCMRSACVYEQLYG